MRASTIIFAVVSLISSASATIYVTQPVASTTCVAGQTCTVAWDDDGNAPVLATIGACQIDLCTGGVDEQTCLQNISPSLDVSQNAQVTYVVNPTIGQNDGAVYFIKFTSLAYKDPTNPAQPYTAFSAHFTLAGMTGTFAASISSELAQTVPVGASTSAPAAATTTAAMPSGMVMSTTTAKAAAGTSSAKSTSTAKSTSGASNVVASFAGVSLAVSLVGLVMGVAAVGF